MSHTDRSPALEPIWRDAGRAECSPVEKGTFLLIALFLLLIFSVQVFSPLRVNPDAVDLLDLASKVTDHQPYLLNGVRPSFPIGIPALFSGMERFGIANSRGFTLLNVLCLVIAAVVSVVIFRSLRLTSSWAGGALVLAFVSFVLMKHVGIPLSDIPYMAASLGCVAIIESAGNASGRGRIGRVIAALILLVIAVLFRRIGVALIPAGLYLARSFFPRARFLKRTTILPLVFIVLGIGLILILLGRYVFYLPDFRGPLEGKQPVQLVTRLFYIRAIDLGEVLLNVPYAKLGRLHGVVPLAGVVLMILIAAGVWRARRELRAAHVYLLSYLAIMFVWPYGDNRFWLPVLPLLAGVCLQGIEPLLEKVIVRRAVVAYAVFYVAMFLIAAFYTTRITFSKNFPQVYAGGQSAHDYLQAWSDGPVDTETARVIRRYGMR